MQVIITIINSSFTPILISLIGIITGLWIFLKPVLTIEMQRKFYEKINWRIEPISMRKEIRNTKVMGMFLALVCLLVLFLGK